MNIRKEPSFQQALEEELTRRYGPMVSGDDLRLVLGYPSPAAFRQAVARQTVPVPVFTVENRRGKFAFVRDVAAWLAAQKERSQMPLSRDVSTTSSRNNPKEDAMP